jgi:hypothetical protein
MILGSYFWNTKHFENKGDAKILYFEKRLVAEKIA